LFFAILIVLGITTRKKEFHFSKYTEASIEVINYDFGRITDKDTVVYVFKIKNVENNL